MSRKLNLSEEFKVENTIQPVADPVMAQALKDEEEKEDKNEEVAKAAKEAEKVIDKINKQPDAKAIKIKPISEKLHLEEELEEDEMFDLVSEIYRAIQLVCRKWAKFTAVDYEDFETAIDQAAMRAIEDEPALWESYNASKKSFEQRYNEQLCTLEESLKKIDATDKKALVEAYDKLHSAYNNFKVLNKKRG